MAYWHYERLSALDTLFLAIEDPHVHMHVGAVATFEAGPLRGEDGALDGERITAAVEAWLSKSPRLRQKLESIPLFRHPVWVDDERFNLSYHVRHTSLPRPGDVRLLKRMAGRVLSQKLDRGKPLWEMWVVEGLEHDRFALIVKAHHCVVDGISGLDLLTGLLRLDPDRSVEPPRRWFPRPAPTPLRLLADEVARRVAFPLSLLGGAVGALSAPRRVLADLQEGALSFGEVLRGGLAPTSSTPLNPDIGPHRRFDWTCTDISAVKEVRSRFGGTLNDVVLATAAGAIGRFLRGRGLRTEGMHFRAQVPVSIRTPAERGAAGNRVVMLMADLPIDVQDPVQRLAQVVRTTERLKRSRQRAGVELLEEFSNRTLTSIFVFFARLATWQRPFNVVVTNVPGPSRPVYLLGARMLEIAPLVPLAWNQALGIALFSYDGRLFWGLNADWDALPDLHDLALALDLEFERLRKRVAEPDGPAASPA
jgi:WS/DGAT/MGAT family acyltransferase